MVVSFLCLASTASKNLFCYVYWNFMVSFLCLASTTSKKLFCNVFYPSVALFNVLSDKHRVFSLVFSFSAKGQETGPLRRRPHCKYFYLLL